MRFPVIAALLFSLCAFAAGQRNPANRPSPPGQAAVTLGGQSITIKYSRPKIRDPKTGAPRKIFGAGSGYLVPLGRVWRLGANEATSFDTPANLLVGGKSVPAGHYTLFALPEADHWTLIVSKKTGEWGIPYPGEQFDFLRVPMQVEHLDQTVPEFTLSFAQPGADTAVLRCDWENTRASISIKLQ